VASYSLPLCEVAAAKEYVVEVAPVMLVNEPPPLVETDHWTVGAGEPEADALKEAVAPEATDVLDGSETMAGAAGAADVTVSLAAEVVAEPKRFEKTARKLSPLWVALAEKE
jgi:hypothetical protein